MININKQEIPFEKTLKQRLEFICEFCKTTPTFINGSIRKIDKTIAEYQSISELTATLKEVETELLNNRERLKLLEENNEVLSLRIDSLNKKMKKHLNSRKKILI